MDVIIFVFKIVIDAGSNSKVLEVEFLYMNIFWKFSVISNYAFKDEECL